MQMITGKDNPAVKELTRLMRDKNARREEGLFIIEGDRICREAILSGCRIDTAVYSESYLAVHEPMDTGSARCLVLKDSLFAKIADTKTPQGVLMAAAALDNIATLDRIEKNGRILVCCGLQDPGNLGTLIRTADAFGLDAVLLTGGCADYTNPKTVRSTMGSIFHLPVLIHPDPLEAAALLKDAGLRCYAAALNPAARPLSHGILGDGCAVWIGNEGNGLPAEVIEACDETLYLPMAGKAESLNAAIAGSILMWELHR